MKDQDEIISEIGDKFIEIYMYEESNEKDMKMISERKKAITVLRSEVGLLQKALVETLRKSSEPSSQEHPLTVKQKAVRDHQGGCSNGECG